MIELKEMTRTQASRSRDLSMASTSIQQLLQPPSTVDSQERALAFLNTHFQSLDQLDDEDTLQRVVDDARLKTDRLRAEVS